MSRSSSSTFIVAELAASLILSGSGHTTFTVACCQCRAAGGRRPSSAEAELPGGPRAVILARDPLLLDGDLGVLWLAAATCAKRRSKSSSTAGVAAIIISYVRLASAPPRDSKF
eukprot:SAG31_NODE_1792_length_7256_cov_1.774626_6_plen_114_part_00